jgi:hypothetical protein
MTEITALAAEEPAAVHFTGITDKIVPRRGPHFTQDDSADFGGSKTQLHHQAPGDRTRQDRQNTIADSHRPTWDIWNRRSLVAVESCSDGDHSPIGCADRGKELFRDCSERPGPLLEHFGVTEGQEPPSAAA